YKIIPVQLLQNNDIFREIQNNVSRKNQNGYISEGLFKFIYYKMYKMTCVKLTLLDWSSGIRVFYCTDAPLEILVEPFKRALIGSLNKFCKNATACRLVKSYK
ncbi:hypothetical protein X798_07348, partial [Onchocerca flexuosa]